MTVVARVSPPDADLHRLAPLSPRPDDEPMAVARSRKRARVPLGVFLFSVLVHSAILGVPVPLATSQDADYRMFFEPIAANILAGRGVVDQFGEVATILPPGYPFILAALFYVADAIGVDRLTLIKLANVVMTSVGSLLVFLIAEFVFSTRVGVIAAVLWASHPFNLLLTTQPTTEVPFILLFYLALWILVLALTRQHVGLAAMVGVTLGLAGLMRAAGLFLALVVALAILFYDRMPSVRRLGYAVAVLAVFLVTIAPWEAHVLRSTGRLIPLSSNGPPMVFAGLTFAVLPGLASDRVAVPDDVRALMERARAHESAFGTTGSTLRYLAQETRENPLAMVKLTGLKLVRSWYGTYGQWHEGRILLLQALYVPLILAGILLGFRRYRDRVFWILLLGGLVAYFWGMTVFVLSILRYMLPAMALCMVFAAVTLDALIGWRMGSTVRAAASAGPARTTLAEPLARTSTRSRL